MVKTWNFNSKPGKNLKFANSMFQASLFKVWFSKKKSDLLLCHIYIINTYTDSKPNWPGFDCFYLEVTWKIHGIFCHNRSGNPASVLNHFEIFTTKICMKVPGIWHKNYVKTWNLGPKTLRKPGIGYLEKGGNPDTVPSQICARLFLCTNRK